MFLIWGTKTVYRKLGYVADFCRICRTQQTFLLRRVGSAGHVYYLSLGQGKLLGHDITCQNCHTVYEVNPARYRDVADSRPVSSAQLARQTFPDYEQVYADRLEQEQRIRFNPFSLSEQERHRLLCEPFWLLSPRLEQRSDIFRLDWKTVLALLALILVCAFVFPLAEKLRLPENSVIFLLMGSIAAILITWYHFTNTYRFVQRHLLPQLATTLLPLRPTEEEIRHVLHDLKKRGMRIGKTLKPTDVMRALNEACPNPNNVGQSPSVFQ